MASPFFTSALNGGEWSLHAPSALLQGKEPPEPIRYEAGRALDRACTPWSRENIWSLPGIKPCPSSLWPVAIPALTYIDASL
jgi:hypothetical protein